MRSRGGSLAPRRDARDPSDTRFHHRRAAAATQLEDHNALTTALRTSDDINALLRDYPIASLLSATSLAQIAAATRALFSHLSRLRSSRHYEVRREEEDGNGVVAHLSPSGSGRRSLNQQPFHWDEVTSFSSRAARSLPRCELERAVRLIEATSRALAAQLTAAVGARRPLEMPYDDSRDGAPAETPLPDKATRPLHVVSVSRGVETDAQSPTTHPPVAERQPARQPAPPPGPPAPPPRRGAASEGR